jgi:hypothetical protein
MKIYKQSISGIKSVSFPSALIIFDFFLIWYENEYKRELNIKYYLSIPVCTESEIESNTSCTIATKYVFIVTIEAF